MKLWMVMLALCAGAQAQEIVGDWQGTLEAGGAQLRLVLHITKAATGSLSATLDSVDQGANGIPVAAVTLADSNLTFNVDAVRGRYEGKVNAEGTAITGTWTQTQPLPLEFHRGTIAPRKPGKPSDIDAAWRGAIDTGAIKLQVVFHFVNMEDGLSATLDVPDQNMKGMPASSVTRNGPALTVEWKQIPGTGRFEGKISSDLATIDGTWSQGGVEIPLVLTRVKDAAELERRRPQNPVKPYPYREEEVIYQNAAAKITLAATLTVPPEKVRSPPWF